AAHENVAQALHAEAAVRSERVGVLRLVLLRRQLHPGFRLFQRHTRLQASRYPEVVALVAGVRIELERDEQLGDTIEDLHVERRREHADHRERLATERDRLAEN